MKVINVSSDELTGSWYDLNGHPIRPTVTIQTAVIRRDLAPVTALIPIQYGAVARLVREFVNTSGFMPADIYLSEYLTLSSESDRAMRAMTRLAEYAADSGLYYATESSPNFCCAGGLTTVSLKASVGSTPLLTAVRVEKNILVQIPTPGSELVKAALAAMFNGEAWVIGKYSCPMFGLRPGQEDPGLETEDDNEGEELLYPCEHCGEEEQGDGREHTYVTEQGNEEQICPSCRSALLRADYSVYECEYCHCLVHRTEAVTDDCNTVLCQHCYEENGYSRCDECNNITRDVWYHDGTDRYLCESCFEDDNGSSPLRGYHERPNYEWYSTAGDPSTGILYLGTECEWSTCMQQDVLAEFLQANLTGCQDESRFFMMEDSSLNDGVELVSMPHTLNAWLELRPRLAGVVEEVASSYHHTGKSDGMHVHISRKGMSEDHELCFIALFDLCQTEWEVFARRRDKYDGYYMYASNDYFDLDNPLQSYDCNRIKDILKELAHRSRYRCVNATNGNTLEVRIFQTPTTTQQWFAAIEATHAAYQFVKNLPWKRLYWLYQNDLLWSAFVRYSSTDPRYMDLREELKNVPMAYNSTELEQAI